MPRRSGGAAMTTTGAAAAARGAGEEVGRAAERGDHALEPLRRRAAVERALQRGARPRDVVRARPAERQQFGAERQRHLDAAARRDARRSG